MVDFFQVRANFIASISLSLYSVKSRSILCRRDAFEVNDDSGDVRKSVGIDKEGGLVFALDTMQVVVVSIG